MFAEDDTPQPAAFAARTPGLRQCMLKMAERLYDQGHVLETITLAQCGLSRRDMAALGEQDAHWAECLRVLEQNGATTLNGDGRFVLTAVGREVLFDLYGQGAADCA